MRSTFTLLYASGAYAAGMISILWIVAFLQDFVVLKGINGGTPGDLWPSILADLGLVAAFGFHHSATARTWFKERWIRVVPPHLERATYLWMTAVMTALLITLWQPVPTVIWHVENSFAAGIILATYLATIALMFSATFPIGHFRLFGLRQAIDAVNRRSPEPATFTARWLYAVVRHPISAGWIILPWLTPHMTVGQLTFALGMCVYILVATAFEEADLLAELGETYELYRNRVPAFLPRLKRKRQGETRP